jgi:hypothetical protein
MAMAQQQHRIGSRQGLGDLLEVGVVHGYPLTGDVAVMAMAQVFATGPQPMGQQ